MWEGQPGFAPGYEENHDLSKRHDLFPYISVYSDGIKNPEQALSVIKKSESLEKVGPYLSKWERWYDFGLKSRLFPHSETKNLITLNSEHLNMLSEEEDKTFYEQEKLYFEIDSAVYSAMKDYLDHWVDKPFDQSYFNDDWEYKQSIFPEWLPDWNIRETSGKIGTGWLQSSYDVLSHNSETDTRNNREYAIGFHTDNDRIDTSMQIYITDVIHNHLGTSFAYIDDGVYPNQKSIPFLTLPYIQNSGYIFKNTNTIRHGMTMSVPDGFDRISLYFYIN